MDFNAYFNSVLKNGFSFLNVSIATTPDNDISKRYISNSDNVIIDHDEHGNTDEEVSSYVATSDDGGSLFMRNVTNISAEFKGSSSAQIKLIDVLSANIKTNSGDDFIEVQQKSTASPSATHTINTGDGNNFISLMTTSPGYNTVKIITGSGNDRIVSTGHSNDIIRSGAGRDLIMAGYGHNLIDGQEGWDTIIFDGNYNDYTINWTDEHTLTVTDTNGNQTEATNVEELVFADQTYILPYQQLVQLDAFEQFYNYFETYYNATYDNEDNTDINIWQSYDVSTITTQNTQSLTVDDWSQEETYADTVISEINTYNDQDDFSQYQELDTLDLQKGTDPQLQDFIRDHLPFDPRDVLSQILSRGPDNAPLFGSEENDQIFGTDGNDHIFGGAGHDLLVGGKGNDLFIGDKGNDIMLGGDGIDTAFFFGMSSDFKFDFEHGTMTDKNGEHGIDFLKSIERLIFLDAVYKITNNDQVELIDSNPFKLLENFDGPHLEVIGLPPLPPADETLPPPTMPSAAEIEKNLMRAYESLSQPDGYLNGPPGVDI